MDFMEEKIRKEGKVLPGGILRVGSFLNQRVDTVFTGRMADAFYERFREDKIDLIMTLEASGIPAAYAAAERFGVPLLIVKKSAAANLAGDVLHTSVRSFTHGNISEIQAAREYLQEGSRVLIVDDFLAYGEAVGGMRDLCRQAHAEVAGVCICIEKGFQGGGDRLRGEGVPLFSLAIVERMDEDGTIEFRKE